MDNSTANSHKEAEEIHQVVGNPPTWLLRFGISVIGIFFLVAIILSWIIKYPDEIESKITLTTENPAIRIFPKVSGQVSKLVVSENQSVKKGDLIAVVRSSSNFEDVMLLEQLTTKAKLTREPDEVMVRTLTLGDLQPAYSYFNEMSENLVFFNKFNDYQKQISSLKRQIFHLKEITRSLHNQSEILKEQLDLAQLDLKRNETLFKSNTISSTDFEKIKMSYLQQKRQTESLNSEITSNELKIEQLESQVVENEKNFVAEKRRVNLLYAESLSKLESEIEKWKQLYTIYAPASGKIALGKIKADNLFINSNEEIAIIVPESNPGRILARSFISSNARGKVKVGMRVVIQLDGYPYQEFGVLIGKVGAISSIPYQDGYAIEIEVSQELLTTYKRKLRFIQELQGSARIILENRSFASRVFDKINSVLRNRI